MSLRAIASHYFVILAIATLCLFFVGVSGGHEKQVKSLAAYAAVKPLALLCLHLAKLID